MLRRQVLWMLPCVVWCWQVQAKADEPKTADEVITKYIEAIGGRKAIDSVKTLRISGKTMMGAGMEAPVTMEFKEPNKVRIEFTFQGMTGIQAYDGRTGWFIMPFMGKTDPEKMPPDQVEVIEDQADFQGILVDYKKKGHQIDLVGKEEAEGAEVYKLKVTKKSGSIEYHFLDAEHFIPTQVKGKRKFQGVELEFEVSFSDYKEVNGLLLAHAIEQKAGPMSGVAMIFEKVEANVDLPDDRFTMPEVKKEEQPPAEAKETPPPPADEKGADEEKEKNDD